jgi:hypothetical protein
LRFTVPRAARLVGLLAATFGSACGGEAPRPSSPARLVEAPPPQLPRSPSRWLLAEDSHGDREIAAATDAGDGQTLYVGKEGFRAVGIDHHALVPAQAAVLDDFVGVQRDEEGRFVLFASDGRSYTSSGPLGPLSAARPGPLPTTGPDAILKSIATGASSVLALTGDGRLLRSKDHGLSWQPVSYAGAEKLFGSPAQVALDDHGNGLLLHLPQRLFVTHDDGATWSPITTASFGARCVARDGKRRLFVCGHHGRSIRLDGDKLELAGAEEFVPLHVTDAESPVEASSADSSLPPASSQRLLGGGRLVTLTPMERDGKVVTVMVSEGPIEGAAGPPVSQPSLVGASGLSRNIASYESSLVYLREDPPAGDGRGTTTVLRSTDSGATWNQEATLEGTEPRNNVSRLVVAHGPRGWTYVSPLCGAVEKKEKCGARQVKPSGASAFEDMAVDELFEPISFAFDETHDRVFSVGRHEQEYAVYESPLSQNRFKVWKKTAALITPPVVTLDAAGGMRVVSYDGAKGAYELSRVDARGQSLPPLYLPFDRNSSFVFANKRGLAFTEPRIEAWGSGGRRFDAWETADGGESWSRVAVVHDLDSQAQCNDWGCFEGSTVRLGWELPVNRGTETLDAAGDPPSFKIPSSPVPASPVPASPAPPVAPSREIACRASGPSSVIPSLPGSGYSLNTGTRLSAWPAGATRWGLVKGAWHEVSDLDPNERVSVLFATTSDLREVQVVPELPASERADTRGALSVKDDGVIVARYKTHDHWQGHEPMDVEVSWWAVATGRMARGTARQVPPFEVSPYGTSILGTMRLVDGGLWIQPPLQSTAYFLHDDGRAETMHVPPGLSVTSVLRTAKRWVVMEARGADADLWWKDVGNESWTERSWTLGEFKERRDSLLIYESRPFDAALSILGGRSMLTVSGAWKAWGFPIDTAIPDDPPRPVLYDPSTVDSACEAGASSRSRSETTLPNQGIQVRIEDANGRVLGHLATWKREVRETPSGGECTSTYVLHGTSPDKLQALDAFLNPERKGFGGWWFSDEPPPKGKDGKRIKATALVCGP